MCRQCRSTLVEDDEQAEYDEEYYASGYDRFVECRLRFNGRLLRLLAQAHERLLLDVGSGSGLGLEAAGRCGWQALGVEPSIGGSAASASRGRGVVRGAAEELAVRDASVSAVLLLDVLAHVKDPTTVAQEATRVLGVGGQALVKTPHRPAWVYRAAIRLPDRIMRRLLHLPHQRRAITPAGLVSLLSSAGMEVHLIERWGEALRLRDRVRGSPRTILAALAEQSIQLLTGHPSIVVVAGRRADHQAPPA